MNYVKEALVLLALVLAAEKAMLFHTKLYMSISLDQHVKIPDPPLFRPVWRIAIYAFYIAAGVAAVEGLIERPLGLILILSCILVLVVLDMLALRHKWPSN